VSAGALRKLQRKFPLGGKVFRSLSLLIPRCYDYVFGRVHTSPVCLSLLRKDQGCFSSVIGIANETDVFRYLCGSPTD
jgi:hypothetical protein